MYVRMKPTIGRASGGDFVQRGIRVGKQRVQRQMQQHGIRARDRRRYRITTTDSQHNLPKAPNLLSRNFTVAAPNNVARVAGAGQF